MPKLTLKPLAGAKHMGRKTTRHTFDVRDIAVVSGLPDNLSATGLVMQMSRGPKLATTKEVELTADVKGNGGGLTFPGSLSFVATLFASKTGKATGFSDKRYRVSLMAVKPTFGSSKRSLKEVASCDLNISEHAMQELPRPLSLQLDRRQHDGIPVTLELKISAKLAAGGGDDDDDDAQSTSTAFTGFDAGREVESEAPSDKEEIRAEQDLEGFDTDRRADLLEQRGGVRAGSARVTATAAARAQARAAFDTQAEREIEEEFGGGSNPFGRDDAPPNPVTRSLSSMNPFGKTKATAEAPAPATSANPFGSASTDDLRAAGGTAALAAAAAFADEDSFDEDEEEAPPARAAAAKAAVASATNIGRTWSDINEFRDVEAPMKDTPGRERRRSSTASASLAPDTPAPTSSFPRDGLGARNQMDLDEVVKLREELSYANEQLSRAQADARQAQQQVKAAVASAEDRRVRSGEAEQSWSGAQREVSKLRAALSSAEEEREEALVRLLQMDTARIAALSNVDALTAQLAAATSGDGAKSAKAAQAAAAQAEASAGKAAEEVAVARAEAARSQRQAAAAETRANEAEEELEGLRSQLAAQAEAAEREKQASDEEAGQLSTLLIEAKMSAAQYAFERDEAKQKAKGLRDELASVIGGGKKVAQHATKMEVKYEALRAKYDADLATLIEVRLELAETKARLEKLELPQVR